MDRFGVEGHDRPTLLRCTRSRPRAHGETYTAGGLRQRYPAVPQTSFTLVTSRIRNYFQIKRFFNALNVSLKQPKISQIIERANL